MRAQLAGVPLACAEALNDEASTSSSQKMDAAPPGGCGPELWHSMVSPSYDSTITLSGHSRCRVTGHPHTTYYFVVLHKNDEDKIGNYEINDLRDYLDNAPAHGTTDSLGNTVERYEDPLYQVSVASGVSANSNSNPAVWPHSLIPTGDP